MEASHQLNERASVLVAQSAGPTTDTNRKGRLAQWIRRIQAYLGTARNWRLSMSFKESWDAFTPTGKAMAVISIIGGALAILTQITPAVSALDDNGFPVVATRAWVREYTGQSNTVIGRLTAKQDAMQIDTLNGKIEAATSSRNSLEIAALKYDDEGKIKAAQEIRRLDTIISALIEQRRAIQGSRGPN